jgi:adenylate kinase
MSYVDSPQKVSDQVASYAETYKLRSLFQRMLQLLIEHKPANPLDFLTNFLNSYTTHQVLVLGPPGSGKATQCKLIADYYGLTVISTRELLRREINSKTELGLKAKEYMEKGDQVPDDIIVQLVAERMEEPHVRHNGWVMDGFPRTSQQADALALKGMVPTSVLVLDVTDEMAEHRATGRWTDAETGISYHMDLAPPPPEIRYRLTQRADDTPELFRKRLGAFRGVQARFAEEASSSKVQHVDGSQGKLKVFQDIKKVLNAMEADVSVFA